MENSYRKSKCADTTSTVDRYMIFQEIVQLKVIEHINSFNGYSMPLDYKPYKRHRKGLGLTQKSETLVLILHIGITF